MPARSRKRGQRERRGGTSPARPAPAAPAPPQPQPGRRLTAEERNAAVRATLEPLAPGERPWAIRVACALALIIGLGDLGELAFGGRVKFGTTHTSVGSVTMFAIVMIVCAVGMWQMRYWAVLGFQALLAFVILFFTIALIRASNLLGFLIPIVVIGGGGLLFFKLVRVLSRLQLPRYRDGT